VEPAKGDEQMPLSFAHQFNKLELSDVKLTLCTCSSSRCAETSQSRTFHLVGFLVVSRSEYFATRLSTLWCSNQSLPQQCGSKLVRLTIEAAGTKPTFKSSSAVVEIVEHVQEADMDAADMLLQSCYTGEVLSLDACKGDAKAMESGIETLIKGHKLADKWLMPASAAACKEELGATLRAGLHTSPQALMLVYGSLIDVLNDQQLHSSFLALPYPAVKAWASCDQLSACSEHDVVAALDAWINKSPHAKTLSHSEKTLLGSCVRVARCSSLWQLYILNQLPWILAQYGSDFRLAGFRCVLHWAPWSPPPCSRQRRSSCFPRWLVPATQWAPAGPWSRLSRAGCRLRGLCPTL